MGIRIGTRLATRPRWQRRWTVVGSAVIVATGIVVWGSFSAAATRTAPLVPGSLTSSPGLAGDILSMRATGIKGPGSDGGQGDISVESFSWGMSNPVNCVTCGSGIRGGVGRGTGRPTEEPLVVVRRMDAASPQFYQDSVSARVIPEV